MADRDITMRTTPRLALQVAGVSMLVGGVGIVLWLATMLWLTGMSTDHAQREMQRQWMADVGGPPTRLESSTTRSLRPPRERLPTVAPPGRPGGAYAVMWFSRPGTSDPPVGPDPLYVVEGVGLDDLRRGPGHYARSDPPGGDGNFAVSGHRTTYGAPFGGLHELQVGDRVHVVDRGGRQWSYSVLGREVVDADATWVLGPDPLDIGGRTMTLATCHPKWNAAQRLVIFAKLVSDV